MTCLLGALVAAVLGASLQPLEPQVNRIPLTIDHTVTVQPDSTAGRPADVSVQVTNTGPQAITAWAIALDVRMSSGKTDQVIFVFDTAGVEAGYKTDLLQPNTTATKLLGFSPPAGAIDFAAAPIGVVFADDSAAGDDSIIERIFAKRQLQKRFWQLVQLALAEAPAGADPATVLNSVDTRLAAETDPEILGLASYKQFRRNLTLAAAAPSRSDALTSIRAMAAERASELVAHSLRR